MSSRAKRYAHLLGEVAAELNEKPDTDLVKHVATMRLMREAIQIRLLAGERVDPADILKIDDALKQYVPHRKPPLVELVVVEGVTGIYACKHCGERNNLSEGEYQPIATTRSPEPPPPVIDGEVLKPAAPKPKRKALPAPAPVERPHPPGIHDQPGVPLKRYDEPWRRYVGTVDNL